MSGAIFGGDEVGALVFDFGSNSIRAGFAGADTPTVDVSSHMGILNCAPGEGNNGGGDVLTSLAQPRYLLGNDAPGNYLRGMEVSPLIQDGMIDNWTYFEAAMESLYSSLAVEDSSHCPVLFSEAPWNSREKRERLTEIMFEKFRVPALYVAKTAVLSCFAQSRSTGLVFDCGASCMSATPVYEGMVLQQGIVRSPFAGDFISRQCEKLVREEFKLNIVPSYRVKTKCVVKVGEMPVYTERPGLDKVHPSFHKLKVKQLMQDFAASVLQVADEGYADTQSDSFPTLSYEFPNGLRIDVGHERFRIPETIFDVSVLKEASNNTMLSACHIISSSISLCDVDARPNLSNIVVVGGTTLIQGFTERLQRDLNNKIPPSMRLKPIPNNTPWERRFSSWLGGSILGSMGTFHQLWVSKQEYEETGKSIIDKKCL